MFKKLSNSTYSPALLLAVLLTSFMSWSCDRSNEEQNVSNEQPNVIIIYADDVGYGDLGVYGSELIPTPNLDRMASEGLTMTSSYATAATCTPSRYSLLTGEYAFRNQRAQILDGDDPMLITPGSVTIPSLFRDAGYKTSIVGKWHLGIGEEEVDWNGSVKPGPLEVGFDESFIIPTTADRVPTVYLDGHHVYNLSDEDDPLRISYDEKIGDLPTGKSHPELLRYLADDQHSGTIAGDISRIGWQDGGQSAWWDDEEIALIMAKRSQDFITENQDEPFFLFIPMHENHVPRAPHPDFVGKSQTGLRGDAVVELDWVVGEVLSKLKELGLHENTLVIFSSDNGPIFDDGYDDGAIENANGHNPSGPFRGGKYTAYEGGTRMPFVASWPGVIEAGSSTDALFSQVDLMATLGSLIGVELPQGSGLDSKDLLPVLLGQSDEGREFVVQQGAGPNLYGIRMGDWKLIPAAAQRPPFLNRKHNERQSPLSTEMVGTGNYLYNLNDDPGETTNLADQHPDKVEELSELLERIRETPEKELNFLN
ncbi:MAG: arylsulfatase [Balneolales bacterium]